MERELFVKTIMITPKVALVRWLTQLSLLGFVYFVAIVAILHILRPDYDPLSRTVSEYANGSYGFLMTSGFVTLSLGSAILVLALVRGIAASARSRAGLAFLTLWSIGVFILSIFPTDIYGIPVTQRGIIHSFVALLSLLGLILASLLCSLRFRHDKQWRAFAQPSLIWAVLMFASMIVFLASPPTFKGITERIVLLIMVAWLARVAIKLRSLHTITTM